MLSGVLIRTFLPFQDMSESTLMNPALDLRGAAQRHWLGESVFDSQSDPASTTPVPRRVIMYAIEQRQQKRGDVVS